MKTSSIIAGLVIAVLVVGGVMWYSGSKSSNTYPSGQTQTPVSQETQGGAPASAHTAAPARVTVTYNGSSFNPSTITIHVGDTVTFVDSSSQAMWVASGVHPTHTVYDGTNLAQHCTASYTGSAPFDECRASTVSYSFTFTKAGTWPFHNHLNSGATGRVIVQ